jgi:hypothetical protein
MLSDVEMHNAPAIMRQNKKHVQDPESYGGHYEEVDGSQLPDMIFQERPPGLGRRLPMLVHIFRDRSLRHFDSELEKFRVQPWCSPQKIGSTHSSNELPDLLGNAGATRPCLATFPPPVESKPLSMPGDDGGRLDEYEAIPPFGPEAGEKDPQDSIRRTEPGPFPVGSLQDKELVAQGHNFKLQGGTRPERASEGS